MPTYLHALTGAEMPHGLPSVERLQLYLSGELRTLEERLEGSIALAEYRLAVEHVERLVTKSRNARKAKVS